jgi:hypothetical protein
MARCVARAQQPALPDVEIDSKLRFEIAVVWLLHRTSLLMAEWLLYIY